MSTGGNQREWTRRRVLAAGCAAVGTVAMGGAARAGGQASAESQGPYAPFKMGLQSYSLRGYRSGGRPDVNKALAVTKELGIHNWEAYPEHIPMTADQQQIAEWKHRLESDGVTLMGYGVVHLGKDEAADRKSFEFARAMGLEVPLGQPGSRLVRPPRQAGRRIRRGRRHPQPRAGRSLRQDRDHREGHQGPSPPDRLLRQHRPLPPIARGPGPRGRGLRQARLRRAPEGREGRPDLHHPRPGRPAHGGPPEGPGATTTNTAWRSSTRRNQKTPWTTSRPASPRPARPSSRYGRRDTPGPGRLLRQRGRRGPGPPLDCSRRRAGDRYTVAAGSSGSTGGGVSRHGDRTRQGVGRGCRSRHRGQVRRRTDAPGTLVAQGRASRHARDRARIRRTWGHVSPGRRDTRSGARHRRRRR